MERGDSLQQQPNAVSPANIRDDWEIEEPVIIPVSEPVLNGGPPMCNRTPTSISTEPPGREREERISLSPRREDSLSTENQRTEIAKDSHEVISVLPSEDPHISCSICEVIDCMIHNPHHRYCMDCGHRLLGPHICPNVDQDLRRPHTPPQIPREPLGITMSPEQVRRNVPHSIEDANPSFAKPSCKAISLRTLSINICKITFFPSTQYAYIYMIAYLYVSCGTRINLDKHTCKL